MSEFAFKVSLPDLIRKIKYRYNPPSDYLSSLIGLLYTPDIKIDITLDSSKIKVTSDALMAPEFFDRTLGQSPTDIQIVIPPVDSYATVMIQSGDRGLIVDGNRDIHRHAPNEMLNTTIITIEGSAEHPLTEADIVGIYERLKYLYWGSDMRVTLNGTKLYVDTYKFPADPASLFHVAVHYDPESLGGIRYYASGRFIEAEPFTYGVDLFIHRHPLQTTITKSHIIKRGEYYEEFARQFEQQLPEIMIAYLDSPQIRAMARKERKFYLALVHTLAQRFKEDRRFRNYLNETNPLQSPGVGATTAQRTDEETRFGIDLNEAESLPSSGVKATISRMPGFAKVFVVCVLMVVCLFLWRQSDTNRRLSGGLAQHVHSPVGQPVSTEPKQPSRPDNKEKPLPPVSTEPKQPSRPDNKEKPIPPDRYVEERMPGANFRSMSDLAIDLIAQEDKAKRGDTWRTYYVAHTSFNALTMKNNNLEWSSLPPFDRLIDTVGNKDLPPELARGSGKEISTAIRAVRSYIGHFQYGAISRDARLKYPDDISAILGERKGDCVASNTLAAHILFQLGYRDVIAVAGTFHGVGHMWLNVKEGKEWHIEDFTPTDVSPELAAILPQRKTQMYLGELKDLKSVLGGFHPVIPGFNSEDSGNGYQANDWAYQGSTLLICLCIIVIIFEAIRSLVRIVVQRIRKSPVQPAHTNDAGLSAATQVGDLLGIDAVKVGSGAMTFDRQTRTLMIDDISLSKSGAFVTAVEAVSVIAEGEPERQKQLYLRLAQRGLR